MTIKRPVLIAALAALVAWVPLSGFAQELSTTTIEPASPRQKHHEIHGPSHLSILFAGTSINSSTNSGITVGIDYEYRISRFLGLGAVVERAAGSIDATTVFAVADLHFDKGWVVQIGLGSEYIEETAFFAARIGLLYEFEFNHGYTLAPQVHFDASAENSIVYGLSFGRSF